MAGSVIPAILLIEILHKKCIAKRRKLPLAGYIASSLNLVYEIN